MWQDAKKGDHSPSFVWENLRSTSLHRIFLGSFSSNTTGPSKCAPKLATGSPLHCRGLGIWHDLELGAKKTYPSNLTTTNDLCRQSLRKEMTLLKLKEQIWHQLALGKHGEFMLAKALFICGLKERHRTVILPGADRDWTWGQVPGSSESQKQLRSMCAQLPNRN